jgi:quercetin dioxygenase-like cupin family protein
MKTAKAWGSETLIANGLYCGKIMHLNQGWQCSLHHHKIKDETFYVLSGRIMFEHGDRKFELEAGDTVHVAPNVKHRFGGIVDSVMVEVSTPHSDEDVYRDEESRYDQALASITNMY